MIYYWQRAWWNSAPYDKKPKEVEGPAKPLYRPGKWVRFIDPSCKEPATDKAMELVGKIVWVTWHEDKYRYEIKCGYTHHNVAERRIEAKMVDVE